MVTTVQVKIVLVILFFFAAGEIHHLKDVTLKTLLICALSFGFLILNVIIRVLEIKEQLRTNRLPQLAAFAERQCQRSPAAAAA